MGAQLSLFDAGYNARTAEVIQFPASRGTFGAPAAGGMPGVSKKVYPLMKWEEITAMADWLHSNAPRHYVLAFALGINLGLRAGELLALKRSDVFNENGTVKYVEDIYDLSDMVVCYQPKVKRKRVLFLNEACKHALEWYYPERGARYGAGYIFESRERNGKHTPGILTTDSLLKKLNAAAQACGIRNNIGTHTLRKTYAVWRLRVQDDEFQKNVYAVQRLLGHKDARTTLAYSGMDEVFLKRAAHSVSLDVTEAPYSYRELLQ